MQTCIIHTKTECNYRTQKTINSNDGSKILATDSFTSERHVLHSESSGNTTCAVDIKILWTMETHRCILSMSVNKLWVPSQQDGMTLIFWVSKYQFFSLFGCCSFDLVSLAAMIDTWSPVQVLISGENRTHWETYTNHLSDLLFISHKFSNCIVKIKYLLLKITPTDLIYGISKKLC